MKHLNKYTIQSFACSFCLKTETLQYVSSSKTYLEEGSCSWLHNSILLYMECPLSLLSTFSLSIDLPSFLLSSIITRDSLRQDCVLVNDVFCISLGELLALNPICKLLAMERNQCTILSYLILFLHFLPFALSIFR